MGIMYKAGTSSDSVTMNTGSRDSSSRNAVAVAASDCCEIAGGNNELLAGNRHPVMYRELLDRLRDGLFPPTITAHLR